MQKYQMPKWEESPFFKGQNHGRKGRKLTLSDEPMVPSVQASMHLVHCMKEAQFTQTVGWTNSVFSSCVGWMEETKKRKIVAPDDPTIWERTPSVYSMLSWIKTEMRQDWSFNTGWTDGRAAVHLMLTKMRTLRFWRRCLQHWMIRRYASEQLCQQIFNG
jgi:hypothetical protein